MSREAKRMCEHCHGRGIRSTEHLIIVTRLGFTIRCNVCEGKGYRIFEEMTAEEFQQRFKRGLPARSL